MATSTFGKQFMVHSEKTDEFVREMTKPVTPTLNKGFQSHLTYLTKDTQLKNQLTKVLSH